MNPLPVLTSAHTERFRSAVAGALGLHFDDAKLAFLADVLQRRLDDTGQGPDGYLSRLEGHSPGSEVGLVAVELTVSETSFFRNRDQFRAFSETVLPDRMSARGTTRQLRILSAGCASGEEAYSVAIAIREAGLDRTWDVSILGVDVNPAVLVKAATARYSAWALRETPPDIQQRWFTTDGRVFALDDRVRMAVTFEERNLAHNDPLLWQPDFYDVIFFRNVLMYFTREIASAVIARLVRSLKTGGYLFLGHAETLRGLSNDFHLKHTHDTFYYQRKAQLGDSPLEAMAPAAPTPPVIVEAVGESQSWVDAIRLATARIDALTYPPRHVSTPRLTPRRATPAWDLGVAVALLREERFTEALEAMQHFPAESGRDPDVLLLHAALLAHRGHLADAEALCRRLLEVDELSAGAHYLLALCREGASDPVSAAHHDQVAVYLDPGFAMPHFHLGLLARRSGDVVSARRELEQAMVLLRREDGSRVLLFGGGFSRDTLVEICRTELVTCGSRP
ncbi:MAG TPA: protein-glutamate O-methyltransferase CheR [Vicinamibacterales bacterium]|nr:protein-glutamate O-methyltransferase CheR [Vicinamibacterales bacterium]